MFDYNAVESTLLEFKCNLEEEKPRSWLKSVSAFANTQGGYILFGVTNDTHEAVGLDNPQHIASKISELIASRISPAPRYILDNFPSEDNSKVCIKLEIQSGPDYPYYYAVDRTREAYVRRGDRSELATDFELSNLILKGRNKTFDALPSNYKFSDVSFTLFNATYKKETGNELNFPKDLFSMGILSENEHVTNAGILLCDQGYLPQSKIVCTRWKGSSKGEVDGDALDDKVFCDTSIIALMKNAEDFIKTNSKNSWKIRGMRREELSDYPYKAVREILINALMHRDYQIIGSEIHVDMYDDRMEIMSPGGLFGGGRIQDLDLENIPSMRRNAVIADIFDRLNYMDRRGSGIKRVINSYDGFEHKPIFYSTNFFFSVTLPNRSIEIEKSTLADEKSTLADEISTFGEKKSTLADEISTFSEIIKEDELVNEDWELNYFTDVILKEKGGGLREKSIKKLITLFSKYRYEYCFNRRIVAYLFDIKENAAAKLINKWLQRGIVEKVKRDEYRFVRE